MNDNDDDYFIPPVGLKNDHGEYNCFLNCVIQVFWHIDVFRKNFHQMTGHVCSELSCIFCALKVIFTQFQFSEYESLPPSALRQAMAIAFKNEVRFQLGEMDDAAECFEKLLSRVHDHLTGASASEDECHDPRCITHRKFVMSVEEEMACTSCNRIWDKMAFNQTVCYVSTTFLVKSIRSRSSSKQSDDQSTSSGYASGSISGSGSISSSASGSASGSGSGSAVQSSLFGLTLREALNEGATRKCKMPGCRGEAKPRRRLVHCPDVITIGLIWETDESKVDYIKRLVNIVGTKLKPNEIFDFVSTSDSKDSKTDFDLVGIVCYYGKHYSSFLYQKMSEEWISIDDSSVTSIGRSWSDVEEKCVRGRYQPLMLLYVNPNARPMQRDKTHGTVRLETHLHKNDRQSTDNPPGPSGSRQRPSSSRPPKEGCLRP